MSFVVVPRSQRSPILLQIMVALICGLILFLLALGMISGGYQWLFSGQVFPGVSMVGMDLSGLTPEQATAALSQRLVYPESGQVVFRYGDNVWVATPHDLGMVFDIGSSVQNAYDVGRRGDWFIRLSSQINTWQSGLELAPVVLLDERVAHGYLQNIATEINRPVVETELYLNGTDVVYIQGQTGRLLDVDTTLAGLVAQLKTFRDGEVPLVIGEQAPLVLDASAEAETLRQALSASLTIIISDARSDDPAPWVIEPAALAGMLTVEPLETETGGRYQVSMDARSLEQFLGSVAPLVNRTPVNARFWFDDPTAQLVLYQSAVVGRMLDIAASRDAITRGLLNGEHTIPLVLTLAQPEVTDDMTAASLGITGLVANGEYTTYFRGSSAERMQNIEAAAKRFHGLLVPPHTTFSMADALGDVSLENGFAEALIIYNGRTITGVGGGVCQVSTTLFRTAFFAGYPIVERHEHAYRVYYYEQTAVPGILDSRLAGLDATVYVPLVDLKFTNDRPYWLLMETYLDKKNYTLTWKFYSTDDGRTVQWENMGLKNVVPAPDPLFEENPELAPGTCKQVDWPGDGADITVTRVIYRDGQQLYPPDSIRTHYEPWQAIYQFGPDTEDSELVAEGACH